MSGVDHDEPRRDGTRDDEPSHEESGRDEPGQDEPAQDEPGQDEPGQDEIDAFARTIEPGEVRAVRLGHGANCSSVGSVVDVLFVGAAAASAILAAVCAAMRDEPVRVVGVEPDGAGPERDAANAEPEPGLPDTEPDAPSPEEP